MMAAASGAALVQWSADDEITVLALPEPTSTTGMSETYFEANADCPSIKIQTGKLE